MIDDPFARVRAFCKKYITDKLQPKPSNQQQLIDSLKYAEKQKVIDADAYSMIEGVIQVSKLKVRDIMVPRSHMVVIESNQTLEVILPRIIESAHSRFPVIGENRDEVIGILLAKDILQYTFNTEQNFDLSTIMRTSTFVPESKRIDKLLKEFRLNHNHMAIVADEYGGVAGLITIEDILECIVGNIEDEHDVEDDDFVKKLADNRYMLKALTSIEDFNEHFNTKLDDTQFDTLAGLLMQDFGRLPKRGETTTLDGIQFKIIAADKRRIRLIETTFSDQNQQAEQQEQ